MSCLRYCKSTIFQANHNPSALQSPSTYVVCDTAKVRFFKQITTNSSQNLNDYELFAILQKYDFSSKSQLAVITHGNYMVVCDTAKVRFFKQITTISIISVYFFCCLRYCKSTIFQANHNHISVQNFWEIVVCDTAKVRFFKQITTTLVHTRIDVCCLRYCKSTIFQANHNNGGHKFFYSALFAILQKYDFSSKSQLICAPLLLLRVVCDTAKVRFFKQITTGWGISPHPK